MKTGYFTSVLLLSLTVLFLFFTSCKDDCPGEGSKVYPVTHFTAIDAGDQHQLSVTRGDQFSITATGCTNDLSDLSVEVVNEKLIIRYPTFKKYHDGVHFFITMPALSATFLSGQCRATLSGFTDTTYKVFNLSGQSHCTYYGNLSAGLCSVSGQSELTLQGIAQQLQINVTGQSEFKGYGVLQNQITTAVVSGQSQAYIFTNGTLTADASGQSTIYYRGTPSAKQFTQSGQARIIQQ
ncbi:MAG: DUF2807 domain-containing protein [Bacteroidia bacterium]|nr:DUF2807 domain-containing protein [Bacteroidia bacterium]